jgi:superfamily I DNA/RNA helicase
MANIKDNRIYIDMTPAKVFVPTPTHEAIFEDVKFGRSATITARAGGGKSSSLAESTKYLDQRNQRILMTTFATEASGDLKGKVSEHVKVKTLHAIGWRILKSHDPQIETDRSRGVKNIAKFTPNGEPGDRYAVASIVSYAKNTLASSRQNLDDIYGILAPSPPTYSRSTVIDIAEQVLEFAKKPNGFMDFDDMIWLPNVWGLQGAPWDVVFIDEAQDINLAQVGILNKSVQPNVTAIYAVADPAQAIYSWRGALPQAMEALKLNFSINRSHLLPISYRCDTAIIQYAQQIVPDIQARPNALPGIVRQVYTLQATRPRDFVISRANRDLFQAQRVLRRAGKLCTILGDRFQKVLEDLLRKSKADSVPKLIQWLDTYWSVERGAIQKKYPEPCNTRARLVEDLDDRVGSLRELATGCLSISAVQGAIYQAFSAPGPDHVLLMTVHKAKGLEADSVWLIGDSFAWFRRQYQRQYAHEVADGMDVEDDNLAYVAITRARHELNIVTGTRKI